MTSPRGVSSRSPTPDDSRSQLFTWDPYAAFDIPRQGKFQCKGRNEKLKVCGNTVKGTEDLYDILEECQEQSPRDLEEDLIWKLACNCLCSKNHQKDAQYELLTCFLQKSAESEDFRLDALHYESRATKAESLIMKLKRNLKTQTSEAERLLTQNNHLEAALNTQRDELAAKEHKNEKIKLELKHTKEKLEEKKSAYAHLECKIRDSNNEWKEERAMSRKIVRGKDHDIGALRQKLENIKLEKETEDSVSNETMRIMEAEAETKDAEIKKWKDRSAKLERRVEGLRRQSAETTQKQESGLNRLEEELEEAEKSSNMQTRIIECLERDKVTLQAETQSLSDKLSECQTELEVNKASLEVSMQDVEVQKEQLKEFGKTEASLAEQVRQLQGELKEAKTDNEWMLRAIQEKEIQLKAQYESQEALVGEASPSEPQWKRKMPERIKKRLRGMGRSSSASKIEEDEAPSNAEDA